LSRQTIVNTGKNEGEGEKGGKRGKKTLGEGSSFGGGKV